MCAVIAGKLLDLKSDFVCISVNGSVGYILKVNLVYWGKYSIFKVGTLG